MIHNQNLNSTYSEEMVGGFDILYRNNTGNKDFIPHTHSNYEVYLLVKGSIAFRTSNGILSLNAGDIIFINSGEVHCPILLNPETEYERIVLYITPETLKRLSNDKISLCECFHNYSQRVFRFPISVQVLIHSILNNIISLKQTKPFGYELLADAFLTQLFVAIHQHINNREIVLPDNELKSGNILAIVKRYIMLNLDKDISIDDLANFVCISKYHFMRTFKKLTGQTVYQYIINKRLENAERLIKSGMDVASAGQKCGFKDYSCFYRAFRNKYNASPKNYCKKVMSG